MMDGVEGDCCPGVKHGGHLNNLQIGIETYLNWNNHL